MSATIDREPEQGIQQLHHVKRDLTELVGRWAQQGFQGNAVISALADTLVNVAVSSMGKEETRRFLGYMAESVERLPEARHGTAGGEA